jgi:hypothetical protein
MFVLVVMADGLAPTAASAQSQPEILIPIGVTNDVGNAVQLRLGLDPAATTGIDSDLGETELPPPPPASALDARFTSQNVPADLGFGGTFRDIRPGDAALDDTVRYEISFQPSTDATSLTFAWSLPDGVTGTLRDVFGGNAGVDEPMNGTGSFELTNLDLDRLLVLLAFDGSQSPTQGLPGAFHVDQNSDYEFRDADVTLNFSGVSGGGVVTLDRRPNGPTGTDGIPAGDNVSAFRWVVDVPTGNLQFDDRTQFRISSLGQNGITDDDGDGFQDETADVQLYRRDTPGSGSFAPLSSTFFDPETNELVGEGFTTFSEFVLGSGSEPLPVELTRFEATRTGEETIALRWATASETNNTGFRVQRRIAEASGGLPTHGWQRIGFVEGAGTTSQSQSYRFRDADLPFSAATVQYRLQQVDTDGTTHLSDVVRVRLDAPSQVQLHGAAPHPANGPTTLRYEIPRATNVELSIFNLLGQRVRTLVDDRVQPGRWTAPLDASGLASGTYVVRLRAGSTVRTERVTVVR